jgi:hypothetical protein
MNKLLSLTLVVPLILLGSISLFNPISAVECEDIKYEDDPLKWGSEDHDDNNPSEKKFYQALEEKTFCDVVKGVDHEELEGDIEEDTKYDIEWLEGTTAYMSIEGTETEDCVRDAYFDSPASNGKDNAADYEMLECIY